MTREEAIKIIEANCSCSDSKLREACAMFIPELRENEDERIMKAIIQFFRDASNSKTRVVGSNTFAEWATYLEKQKKPHTDYLSTHIETLPDGGTAWHSIGYLEKQKEQKPAENYLEWRNIVYYVLKEWLGIGQYMDMSPFNDIVKTLQKRYSLPKPAEWGDEEKSILLECVSALQNSSHWLLADKLSSLHPQSHWKPSEEQIKALKIARSFVVDDFSENPTLSEILKTLQEQLEKLK